MYHPDGNEGKNVPRLGDMMVQNKGASPNTAPLPEVQPPTAGVATEEDTADNPIKSAEFIE